MLATVINFLLNIIGTLVQIILLPINTIVINAMPDLTDKINQVSTGISSLFNGFSWAIGLIPPTLIATLQFILVIEICKHTIWANSRSIVKIWNLLTKIKFWYEGYMTIIIIFSIALIIWFGFTKLKLYDIRLNTFFKKGLKKIDDRFGVYFVTGRQGSGKTYYAIYLALQQVNFDTSLAKIYTNVHSLNIPNANIVYFDKIEDVYYNTDEHCIFIVDEVSRKWDKNSRTDKQFYAFMNQCRKMRRILILITQEWRELPMWIRRPAKFMISTKPTKLLNWFGIYTSCVGDAENMVFDKDEGEYNCPPLKYVIYKRNKNIAEMYDTFEPINML